jgi:hypothetical protein
MGVSQGSNYLGSPVELWGLVQRVPRMTHSSFSGLGKNLLDGASSALPGARLGAKPVCLAYYAVCVLVYFYSAITAREIDTLTSVLFVFLVS